MFSKIGLVIRTATLVYTGIQECKKRFDDIFSDESARFLRVWTEEGILNYLTKKQKGILAMTDIDDRILRFAGIAMKSNKILRLLEIPKEQWIANTPKIQAIRIADKDYATWVEPATKEGQDSDPPKPYPCH